MNFRDDISRPVRVAPGQRWTSNSGAPALVVLERSHHDHDKWLVASEHDGVMTTVDEWRILDDYELSPVD